MRVTNLYLLPPMLKTTQLPTSLAEPNSAITSAHECHATLLWLTWVCHARKGPSESSQPGVPQNCGSLVFEHRALIITSGWAESRFANGSSYSLPSDTRSRRTVVTLSAFVLMSIMNPSCPSILKMSLAKSSRIAVASARSVHFNFSPYVR